VPVFALANAGIGLSPQFLARAVTSPITVGIFLGYVVGKPVGLLGTAWLVTVASRDRVRPGVGWAAIGGCGALAGIGFTVALLIATLAFSGTDLQEAKLGILCAALGASALSWAVFRITALLSPRRRTRALLGTAATLVDLAVPVDAERDHIRGPEQAAVTLVEYGDFECPYCGRAEPVVRELLASFGDLRYVWRHLPLSDVHAQAQLAAEAAEAAAEQGAFWAMHDLLLARQDALRAVDLVRYAAELELDVDRFRSDLRRHGGAARIAEDVDSAGLSGVSGTPTFFLNGIRQYGAYDVASLTAAVHTAKARLLAGSGTAAGPSGSAGG
jgi:protein-disulfide isomerase